MIKVCKRGHEYIFGENCRECYRIRRRKHQKKFYNNTDHEELERLRLMINFVYNFDQYDIKFQKANYNKFLQICKEMGLK